MTTLPPGIIQRARQYANANTPERVRATIITTLIAEARHAGYEIDHTLFVAAGYQDEGEYWQTVLSEPMTVGAFFGLLAVHKIDPHEPLSEREPVNFETLEQMAAAEDKGLVRGEEQFLPRRFIDEFDHRPQIERFLEIALERARDGGESWVLLRDGLPKSAESIMVRPREAAEWLLKAPKWCDLLPSGLRAYLSGDPREESVKTGAPGRLSAMHLIRNELDRRAAAGEMRPTLRQEAQYLVTWLASAHPGARQPTVKTIENDIRAEYKRLANRAPK